MKLNNTIHWVTEAKTSEIWAHNLQTQGLQLLWSRKTKTFSGAMQFLWQLCQYPLQQLKEKRSTSTEQFFGFPSRHDPRWHTHAKTTRAIGFTAVTDRRQALRGSNAGTFSQNYFFTTLSSSKLVVLDSAQRRSWIMQHLLWQRRSAAVTKRHRCVPQCPKSMSRQEIKTRRTPSKYQLIGTWKAC